MAKKKTIGDLNKLYSEASEADHYIFSEYRSNVLLASGDHYNKRFSRYWRQVRDARHLSEENKLRLTKNHIHKIVKHYINGIYSQTPGVAISPKNDKELQDLKAAQLHNAIWQDVKHRHKIRQQIRHWVEDFVTIGEAAIKLTWNPNKGRFLGWQQKQDEDGQDMNDASGQAVPSDIPVFEGDLDFERIMAFNLLRDPSAKTMDEGYKIVRKMISVNDLKVMYAHDEEKQRFIQPSSQDVYTVFEGSSGNYHTTKNQTMLKEYYFPVSSEHPNGYYYITTQHGVLEEGELPFGLFPIITVGFDEIQTTPRSRSLIKQLRPCQAEVNRAASAMATHQITLGDDKLLIQAGTKITQGSKMPGVRVMNYSGAPPQHFPGRAGDQFMEYMLHNIEEMYKIANLQEELMEKPPQKALDPFAQLFQSIKHKKKYSLYAEKFEWFLVDICEMSLKLMKHYAPDEMVIPAISRLEIGNIPEWRDVEPLGYEVKLEPQDDDLEMKMGKQFTMNHILQYVGNSLDKDDIGRIVRSMPYANNEQALTDLTTDYDNIMNDILSLDRGEYPEGHPYDDHKYVIRRLVHRTKQPDFKYLHQQIQQNYFTKIQQHEQMEAENLQKIKRAQQDFIPSTGPLVKVDFYVKSGESGKTERAKIPADAVQWLIKRIEEQGISLDELKRLQQGALAEISEAYLGNSTGGMPAALGAAPGADLGQAAEPATALGPGVLEGL